MGISLSGGPWQYNRFDVLSEKAKPDYIDADGDGNEKESMKKAFKDKAKGKKDDCGCDKEPCGCDDKKDKKEEFVDSVKKMIEEGQDLSGYTWDELYELYKGKHGQSEKEYQDGRSRAGKQISGDSKYSGAEYSHRSYRGVGKPAKPGERQKDQGKMTDADRNELAIRKNQLKKEETELQEMDYQAPPKPPAEIRQEKQKGAQQGPEFAKLGAVAAMAAKKKKDKKDKKAPPVKRVFESSELKEAVQAYLVKEGYVNNPVSAEVMYNHMSEDWLEMIRESLG